MSAVTPAAAPGSARAALMTPVLIAGSVIIMISFAVRASFGVFQIPIAQEFNWPRSEFSMALAIQSLAWGIGQPIFGAVADRFGNRLAVLSGGILYALGLVFSGMATTPLHHDILQFIIGFGIAGTGFGVILAVVGRATPEAHRSMAMGIATAAGSAGQVFGAPVAELLLSYWSWQVVFVIFAVAVLASLVVLPLMQAPDAPGKPEPEETMGAVLTRALKDPSYTLIFLGFFSCGYQLAFITAHFPAMVTEMCRAIDPAGMLAALGISTTSALGAVSIALIGLANIAGTIYAGWLGSRYNRKYLLAGVYLLRTIASAVFIMLPITPLSVVLFSLAMGSLWLATVPLTSGLVAQLWGMRYMGTLYGLVFFSHQLGGFMGIWLGGRMYDLTGDYTMVWWIGVGVGAFSALCHLPIRNTPRPVAVAA